LDHYIPREAIRHCIKTAEPALSPRQKWVIDMPRDNALLGRWAVAACFFVNGFMTGSWAPQIPVLVGRFTLRETTLGLLIVVFGVGAVLAMPICGYLIGRFGSRAALWVTSLLCSLSLVGIAAAPSIPFLVPGLMFFGALLGS